jgi:hypothetical protein
LTETIKIIEIHAAGASTKIGGRRRIAREKGRTSVRIENSKYLCSPAESEHPNVPILVLDYLSERPEARLCHADSMPAELGLS